MLLLADAACDQLLRLKSNRVLYRPAPARTGKRGAPQQMRRAMPKILAQVGTPARPPRYRGKSPGRSREAIIAPAPRYEVVRKGPKGTSTS